MVSGACTDIRPRRDRIRPVRRPRRPPARVLLESDRDHRSVRQPDRIPVRTRARRRTDLTAGIRSTSRRSATPTTARAMRRSSSSPSTSSTSRGPIAFSTYRAGVRDPDHAALHPNRDPHARRHDSARARLSPDLSGSDSSPRALPANGASLLRRIEVEGVDGDARETLPPLDFAYTGFDPSRRVYQRLSAVGDAVPERSLAHPDFELADLFGRGLPDVVQIGDVSRYWRNLGDGRFDVPRLLERLARRRPPRRPGHAARRFRRRWPDRPSRFAARPQRLFAARLSRREQARPFVSYARGTAVSRSTIPSCGSWISTATASPMRCARARISSSISTTASCGWTRRRAALARRFRPVPRRVLQRSRASSSRT